MCDYVELVKALRHCATVHDCTGCDYGCDTNGLPRNRNLLNDAADAIEEVSKRADELGEELTAAMELVHKRNEKIEKLQSELVTIRNQLPKHGEWIEDRMDYKCSACCKTVKDEIIYMLEPYQFPAFCPYCGVKLETPKEETE